MTYCVSETGYDIAVIKYEGYLNRGIGSRIIDLNYERVIDDISTASVTISTPCLDDCGDLASADTWNTDLVILFGNVVQWRGPITKIRYRDGAIIIEARDILSWLDKRVFPITATYTDDLVNIAENIWNEAVNSVDPPFHRIIKNLSGITQTREMKESDNRIAWNIYGEMLPTGLDVTTFGSSLFLGMPQTNPIIMDDTMVSGEVEVVKDGEDQANRVISTASGDIQFSYPEGARKGVNGYPLLEVVYSDSQLQNEASAEAAAKSRYDFSARGIRRVSASGGLVLLPTSGIDYHRIIAGQLVNFRSTKTCYQAEETLRLGRLSVSVNGEGTVASIDLQPLGSYLGSV